MKPTTKSTRHRVDDIDKMLDEALQETFPASDPVACTATPSIGPAAWPGVTGQAAKAPTSPAKPARGRFGNPHAGTHSRSD